MTYHVLFIYCPHEKSERWIEAHEEFKWDVRPKTWESMQLVYRFLKLKKKARYLYIFAIKLDEEYQKNPHRCVYAKPKTTAYIEGGEYGNAAEKAS